MRSPGQPRFGRLLVAPKASATVELVEEGGVVERIAAAQLSSARLASLLTRTMPDEAKALLTSLKAEIGRAEAGQAKVVMLDARVKEIEADIARTRENLSAVGKAGAAEAAKKLGEKLLALEETLVALRREREATAQTSAGIRRTLISSR